MQAAEDLRRRPDPWSPTGCWTGATPHVAGSGDRSAGPSAAGLSRGVDGNGLWRARYPTPPGRCWNEAAHGEAAARVEPILRQALA